MRIEALKHDSNIVFTIGNHDHHTIIMNSYKVINQKTTSLDEYITNNSRQFFKNLTYRSYALFPFYECNPFYIFKLINEDNSDNTIFVHGGLHYRMFQVIPNYDDIIKLQDELSSTGLFKNIQNLFIFNPHTDRHGNPISPLWTRYYSDDPEACNDIKADLKNTLIVVGHTPTSSYKNHKYLKSIVDSDKQYATCNQTQSCVLLGCPRKPDMGPNMAWVDSSMSSSFFNNSLEDESKRQIEILKLGHSRYTKRYYNIIDRVKSPKVEIINVFMS